MNPKIRPFNFIQKNLRISIFAAFSVLLLLSFALVGTAFNIAVRQYIRSNAVAQLNEARGVHYGILSQYMPDAPFLRVVMGHRPDFFRTNLRSFVIDDYYRPLNPAATHSAYSIADMLALRGLHPSDAYNVRLDGHDQTYFISSATAPGGLGRYIIYYVDVTDLQRFTHGINVLLLSLAALIWLVAMAITGFLAGSLARPLYILRDFARRIGNGDFTPNPISFAGEEFEALNQSLNHTAKQLAKYDNDQKTFFQNASHELRTPLMTIESYAEGIKYGIMKPDRAAETILEATNRLSVMVDDILYISRIDNIAMPAMEQCDLLKLIQERISLQRPLAEMRGLEIKFEPPTKPVVVNCAISYIGRALDNLIANALRFAKNTITIECRLAGSVTTIAVLDDGPGFEPEVLSFVFERFFKGKNGLTGIGLAVVRSIVEQHKGTAVAENINPGAKLTISLPKNL